MQTEPEHDALQGVAAPPEILRVWRSFDGFPMETLTKAWVYERLGPRQRTVDAMKRHRNRFGASGNCFDLAIWLRHRLTENGVEAFFVSDGIESEDAHVAVVAEGADGRRFLCDLGDMWLQPVAIDATIATPLRGLFPAADISLETSGSGDSLLVRYHRHGGKSSSQTYRLKPIPDDDFFEAAEANQRYLAQRLVEARDIANLAHWEYDEGVLRRSTHDGLFEEQPPRPADASTTAALIGERTGMDPRYVEACLEAFARLGAALG